LATPSGTEVLATGDGVVTRVATHKYAGKYVVIDYTGPYSSRFLHLSKILVTKGQKIKRGQVIALSGNTGRTTGAHLHYELHIRGRPVNPMTTDIPTTQSIPADKRAEYNANVQYWQGMMESAQDDVQVAEDGSEQGTDSELD
jgi:murein DD-endopeptidase